MGEMVKKRRTLSTSWDDLPDDCWEIIFGRLGHGRHLQPISEVCKRFHAIANLVRYPALPALLPLPQPPIPTPLPPPPQPRRRPIQPPPPIPQPLPPINTLPPRGHARSALRTLACTHFDCLADDDLFVVADCFSYLRRLHLQHHAFVNPDKTMTDQGICATSTNLTLSICTNDHVSHRSFEQLSANCPLLCGSKAKFGLQSRVRSDHLSSFASLSSLELEHVKISESALVQLSPANLKV